VTQQARDVLARIDGLVAANESALHLSLRNIETVTSTLADNSARLDKVMEACKTSPAAATATARSAAPRIRSAASPTISTRTPTTSRPDFRSFPIPASRNSKPSPLTAAALWPN
jgi:ABC-type transporter Mla subunit MlaD